MALCPVFGRLIGRHKSSVNPSLLAAVGASLLAALWLVSRRRPPAPFQRDVSDVVALNRAQITLARAAAGSEDAAVAGAPASGVTGGTDAAAASVPPPPVDGRDRHLHLRHLEDLYRAGGDRRLQAMTAARLWGHPAVLPLLRRGLRDADPQVMVEAARAMQLFRGKPAAAAAAARGRSPQAPARPRRVARTR
jgi:hypothetical protein